MGACCTGMKSGEHKSLPENQKANNVDEKDKCADGPQGDATVATETPVTADQQHAPPDKEASGNHTADHTAVSPDQVELKITEPEPEPLPAVCPVAEKCELAPAPATQPTATDEVAVENDQNKPSTKALFVSEDGDIVPPTSASEVTTTTTSEGRVQITTTEVHTTSVVAESLTSTVAASTNVEKAEEQPEVEPVKPGDDVVAFTDAAIPSPVVEQVSAATDGSDHGPAEITAGTDDHQKQVDTDAVEKTTTAEVIVATSTDDQQESAQPTAATEQEAQQVPEQTVQGHETNSATDAAPDASEQVDSDRQGEQLSTPTVPVDSEIGDAPAATTCVEPVVERILPDVVSVEPGEQPHVEVVTEQTSAEENTHKEALKVAAETPLSVDVTAVAAEEPHETPSGAESTDGPQQAAEQIPQPRDVEVTDVPSAVSVTSSDSTAPVIDDSASKPTAHHEVGEIQPEELPPPLTPEKEGAAAPATDEFDRSLATSSHVEPPTDTCHQQPDEHPVHDAVNSVEQPTSKSHSEAADHTSDVPVTGEP